MDEIIQIKSSLPKLPYLNIDIIKKYGNLVIKTADGLEMKISMLILVSVSQMFRDFLKEINDVQDVVILSEFESLDLKMFRDFIMEGYFFKIIGGSISSKVQKIFQSFGINLNEIMKENKELAHSYEHSFKNQQGDKNINGPGLLKKHLKTNHRFKGSINGNPEEFEENMAKQSRKIFERKSKNDTEMLDDDFKNTVNDKNDKKSEEKITQNGSNLPTMRTNKTSGIPTKIDKPIIGALNFIPMRNEEEENSNSYEIEKEIVEKNEVIMEELTEENDDQYLKKIAEMVEFEKNEIEKIISKNSSLDKDNSVFDESYEDYDVILSKTENSFNDIISEISDNNESSMNLGKLDNVEEEIFQTSDNEAIDIKESKKLKLDQEVLLWIGNESKNRKKSRKRKQKSLPSSIGSNLETTLVDEDVELWEPNQDDDDMDENISQISNITSQITGISMSLNKGKGTYIEISYEKLCSIKEKVKNKFDIKIPAPGFTTEDFKDFKFPENLEDLEVIPSVLADVEDVTPKKGTAQCGVCGIFGLNTYQRTRDHHIRFHTIHYECPIEDCR